MSEIAVEVHQVSKKFHRGEFHDSLRDFLPAIAKRLLGRGPVGGELGKNDFWALSDVSFQVRKGEVLGIVGSNGAGKSTLLKILSKILKPTRGSIRTNGRMRALIEVAAGFHGDLTGRENVYLNGAILGMKKAEIDAKFDEIVDFSGVESFLDTPVKRYSSGMQARLGFAVAAHLDPEILIVDEVLAVGDTAFQRKCLGKMEGVSRDGRTVLFVSHNMPVIRSLTSKCLYLRRGKMVAMGPTVQVIDRYLADALDREAGDGAASLDAFRQRDVSQSPVRVMDIRFESGGDSPLSHLVSGEDFTVKIEIDSETCRNTVCFSMSLYNEQGERAVTLFSRDSGLRAPLRVGRQTFAATIKQLPLAPGKYTIHVGVNETADTVAFDVIGNYPAFTVQLPDAVSGALEWPHRPWGAVHWSDVQWEVTQ